MREADPPNSHYTPPCEREPPPPMCHYLPPEAALMLRRAALTKGPVTARRLAIDAALDHVQTHYPHFFRPEVYPS